MSRDTTVIPFRQPDAIEDPLTEVAREGARRMLAQVLIAEADAFVALWKEIAGRPRPHRASRPWTAARHPKPGLGLSRSGAPKCATEVTLAGRRKSALPAEVGAADQEPRRAVASSLPARGVGR